MAVVAVVATAAAAAAAVVAVVVFLQRQSRHRCIAAGAVVEVGVAAVVLVEAAAEVVRVAVTSGCCSYFSDQRARKRIKSYSKVAP